MHITANSLELINTFPVEKKQARQLLIMKGWGRRGGGGGGSNTHMQTYEYLSTSRKPGIAGDTSQSENGSGTDGLREHG